MSAAMNHRHRQPVAALSTGVVFSGALAILPYVLISSRQHVGTDEHVGDLVGSGLLLIGTVAGLMILEAIVLRQLHSLMPRSSMATLFVTAVSGYLGSTVLAVLRNPTYHFNAGDEVFYFAILYLPALIISAVAYFAVPRRRR